MLNGVPVSGKNPPEKDSSQVLRDPDPNPNPSNPFNLKDKLEQGARKESQLVHCQKPEKHI